MNKDIYADKDRLTLLREIVADGKDAEAIKKYSDKLLYNALDNLTTVITKDDFESKDIMKAAYDYRAAFALASLIDTAIKRGQQKEGRLEDLLDRE